MAGNAHPHEGSARKDRTQRPEMAMFGIAHDVKIVSLLGRFSKEHVRFL